MATYDPKAELLEKTGFSTASPEDARAELLKSTGFSTASTEDARSELLNPNAAIDTGMEFDPDQAAKSKFIAKKIDVPREIVMEDIAAAERKAKADEIKAIVAGSKPLSSWAADPYNASISHDDMDNLSVLDKAIGTLRDGASFTGQALASFIPRVNEGVFGIAQAGTEIGALVLDPLVGNVLPQNPLAVASSFFSEQRRQSAEAAERWMPNTEGNLQAGIASGVQSLGQNLALMPFALVNPAAGLALMTAPVFGQSFGEARDAGASLPTSINYAGVNAGAEYVFERMPLFKLVEDMNVGTSFLKTLGKQLAFEIPGEQLTTIVQDMNEWAVLNPEKPFSDYLSERPDAALQTLIATAVGAGGQVSVMKGAEAGVNAVSRRIEAAARAEAKAQYIESAGEALKASKTMGRDAESVEAFIEQAIADGKMDVYIDAATLKGNEFYQDIIAASPSVREQVELAAATGEEVRISAVEYLTKIAPQEFAQTLTDDIRLEGEDFTRRQAREFLSKEAVSGELQNEIQSLIERADKDANTFLELNSLAQTIADNANFGDKITDEQKLESAKQIAAYAITQSRRLGRTIDDVIAMLPGVQAESVIPGGNAMMQSDGITTIYHGTTPEAAEAIEAGGFDTSKSSDGTIWFTSNPEIGEVAATGKGAVVKRAFSESGLKLGGWEESDKYSVAELIAQGYDGLKLVDEGETTYQIFNPDKLEKVGDTGSTGSQLTGRTGVAFFQGGPKVEAGKRKYTDDKQLQLFLDNGPVETQAGQEAEVAQREAVAAVDDLRSSENILALALSSDLAERQRTNLVGQKITSPEDLAILAQVYRDPRFETFRTIFVDSLDVVVAQVGITCRLPASSSVIIGDDSYKYFKEVASAAKKAGATGYYIMHNHPSGIATPSPADVNVTSMIADETPDLEFKSHVVIDTNEYSTIDANGSVQKFKKDFGQYAPYRAEEWNGLTITGPDDIAKMAKKIGIDEQAVTIIHADSQLNIKSIGSIPVEVARKGGDAARIAITKESLKAKGAQVFAVSNDEVALYKIKDLLTDAIHVMKDGFVRSFRELGSMSGGTPYPEDRRARVSPDTTKEFDYLRKAQYAKSVGMRVAEGEALAPEENELIVTHNLTAANLLHAEKMGGLPVPSLAVVKKDQPLSGFGEITLIAPSDLINPKTGAKVFGADIYSPRYPKVTYNISIKDQRKADVALTGAKLATDSRIEFSEIESEGPRYLERNRAMMYDFLQSKGITPKIVRREAKAMSEVFEPFANASLTARELAKDHAFMDAAKERYIDIMTIVYANTEGDNEGKTDRQLAEEEWTSMDDQDRRKVAYQYAMEVRDIIRQRQQEGEIDTYATERAMRDQIENDALEAEFATHIEKFMESMNPEEKIFQGFTPSGNRKYIEHSLDNVIKILKKELRGGESFNYGLGSVRAKYTPEFKSIEAIRKEKGRLTDKDSFAKIKEEMNVEFEAIADKLAHYHTYSGSLMNAVAGTLGDAAKMGIPRALSYNGFEGVPDSTMEEMRTFLQQLKNMPTEYFEAKVLRAVELNEFGAAVVPDNVDQKVIDILRKRGITDIRTYKAGDEADRARAIAEEEKLLFQRDWYVSGLSRAAQSLSQNKGTPEQMLVMLKNAGAKQAEIEAIGLPEFLELAGKSVTKEQIINFVSENGVKVDTTILDDEGNDYAVYDGEETQYFTSRSEAVAYANEQGINVTDDTVYPATNRIGGKSGARNTTYTLPGGENHKEFVLSIPNIEGWNQGDTTHYGDVADGKAIAWIRTNERIDSEGKKVLFIEEIQSKRAQEGRAKGFKGDAAKRFEEEKSMLLEKYGVKTAQELRKSATKEDLQKFDAIYEESQKEAHSDTKPKSAPFVEKTDAWVALSMKRMISYAAENGFDRIAWTTGEQQADRYDLSTQISAVNYYKNNDGTYTIRVFDNNESIVTAVNRQTEKEVEDLLGKELAKKIIDDEGDSILGAMKELSGLDLKVGGEGMKGFYDKIIPKIAKELNKKFGGNGLTEVDISIDATISSQLGFDITPKMREMAADGLPLFQKKRGAFSPSQNLIIMLKDADLSTFLHESGHFFLENHIAIARQIIGEASFFGWENLSAGEKQHLTDVGTLMKWYDIGGDIVEQIGTWDGMDFEEQRDYHERFAEGYERYLFEGNAPSIELVDVFKQFTVFLKRVYSSIKNMMDINKRAELLTDEVREVMDRMLATDEQIEIMKKARGMTSAFQTAEQGGMTIEEFKAYQDQGIDADDDAAIDLAARSLRDLKWARNAVNKRIKELQKEAKAARAQVTMEVRPLVMSQPVYQAWRFLTGKMTRDDKRAVKPIPLRKSVPGDVDPSIDSLHVAIAKLGGIDRELVETEWGWDRKEKSPMPVFGAYLLRREGGRTIDGMAEVLSELGYLDVDENGKWDLDDLEAGFFAEHRGDKVYSKDVDHDAVFGRDELQGAGVVDENLNEGMGVKAGRLDRNTMEQMGFSSEVMAKLESLGMLDDIGIHPDIVAQISGYDSGDQMIQEIVAAKPPKEVIADIVDERMMNEYADLATDKAMKDAADLAVHNEARGRFIATEANAIAKLAGKPKLMVAAAKELADKMVGRMTVGELKSRSHALGLAEARSSKAKLAASKDGNWNEAATHSRNQVINFQAKKATMEAHEYIMKQIKSWADLSRKSDDKIGKTYDIDILNAFRSIIGEYGIAEKRSKKASEYLELFKTYDPEMYGVIKESVDAAQANAKQFNKMTVDEFKALFEELDAILHLAKRVKKSEADGNLIDIQEAEDALINQMNKSGRGNVNYGQTSAITPGEMKATKLMAARSFLRRVGSWVESMDLSDFGPFRQFIYQPIADAAVRYRSDRAKYLRQFQALLDPIKADLKPMKIHSPELGYTFGMDESGSAMNEILHALIHTGNDSNKRKLLLGRGWAQETADGELNSAAWERFIARLAREGKLRKEHYDFVQGVWDLLEETKPLAQKTHRDVFGKYFDEVSADGFIDPFGISRRGGYAPAQVDSRIVKDKTLAEMADVENQSMVYAFPTTQKGFTKARVEYNRPLLLDIRSLPQHIDKVLKFSHMEGVGRDVRRILSGDAGKRLTQIDPSAIDAMLMPWLQRSMKQVVETPIAGDYGSMRLFSALRARAGASAMMGNLINTLQQVSGFTMAAIKVKPSLMASSLAQYTRNPIKFTEAVASMSPYMDQRMANEVSVMTNHINDILVNPSLREAGEAWMMKHAYFLQTAMDNVMSPIIWMAGYNQAVSEGHGHDEAIRIADGVIRQTQGSTLPEDIARIESGNAFVRMFTQFAGWFNMQANLMGSEFSKLVYTTGLRKGAGRALYVVMMGFVAQAIVAEAITQAFRGAPDDEDDDGAWLDEWLAQVFGWSILRNATAMIPVVGPVINASINAANSKPYDDRIQTSPAISMLESAARAPVSVYDAIVDDKSKQKAVRDVSALMSMYFGLPTPAVARQAGYLAGVLGGEIDPTSGADFARGMLTGIASNESKQ